MKNVTFITGNQSKADYLAKFLGYPVEHRKVDMDEIQSLDLRTVVEHKVRQAYDIVKAPVIVEDVSLEFVTLGRLPGAFIRFYVDEVPMDTICRTLDGLDRSAIARCVFGYFDGERMEMFESSLHGRIVVQPAGENGFGWDKIFVEDGFDVTRAQFDDAQYKASYTKGKPFAALKTFLDTL
jgi:inosine triphosphate pyrophosphatase